MNNPSRNRNLLFIIGILVLTNIAVLGYFLWFKKPVEPRRQDPRNGMTEMLKKDVGFNDDQTARYKQLKDEQWATIKPMFDEMRKAKVNLFRLLSDPNTDLLEQLDRKSAFGAYPAPSPSPAHGV